MEHTATDFTLNIYFTDIFLFIHHTLFRLFFSKPYPVIACLWEIQLAQKGHFRIEDPFFGQGSGVIIICTYNV